jgi:hypothetical protein
MIDGSRMDLFSTSDSFSSSPCSKAHSAARVVYLSKQEIEGVGLHMRPQHWGIVRTLHGSFHNGRRCPHFS